MEYTHWFIIYTRPKFEQIVLRELNQKGIESFLPLINSVRQWSDRKKKIEMPLFPGYVFVRLPENRLYEVLSARGAIKFVSFSDEIAKVRDEEIEQVKQLISTKLEIEVSKESVFLEKGETVWLKEGPFAGQTLQFIDYKGGKRGVFHLKSIDKDLLVNIPLHHVEPVGAMIH